MIDINRTSYISIVTIWKEIYNKLTFHFYPDFLHFCKVLKN
ncbi:hypothetical protein HMPREF9421_1859 [Streptococcus australis ATCC 700641]|uniref:Uncharacterized protein n=1 Tax=Streptococcus australis ATCC 700641 TaxID=888833 RepID=E7SCS3_9STRE|nr:hypothetical protein HMPREF9421_1859 [Streptococcus australis ATCC 700641]EGU66045.1 hypothetical protein HMPREF9961_0769 [Streptococcus australis ATCC 700641]